MLNRFGIEYAVFYIFMYFCFLSIFLMQPSTENLQITKLATRKKFDPRNTHDKVFWIYEIPTEKIYRTNEIPTKAQWYDDTRPMRATMVRHEIEHILFLKNRGL